MPEFSLEEVEARYDWAVERVGLEAALAQSDLPAIQRLCCSLAGLLGVVGPHQARVQPELYLAFVMLLMRGNISLASRPLWNKMMKQKVDR